MSFPLQPGGRTGNTTSGGRGGANSNHTDNRSTGKASMNPTSIDAMFQGILPAQASASPSNPRQLSGLNMQLGPLSAASGGMVPSSRLSQAAAMSHAHTNSLNSNLGEEIKRLQQLHQLSNAAAPSSAAGGSNQRQQFMQGLLAQRSLGVHKNVNVVNPSMQASMLQQLNVNQPSNLNSLSQRDAAAFLLMSQQQQQQQQQQVAALQQQHQATQQLLGTGGVISSSAAAQAQLMAAQQQMLPSPSMLAARAAAGGMGRAGPGAIEPFPEKLHRMLTEVELTGRNHIISFVDEGRAFAIHKPNQFFKEIVPLYFRQSRLSSFKRQLNLYGFELISNGPSRGAYFHELFQRDKPTLCRRMRRVAVKVAAKNKDGEGETAAADAKKKEQETNPKGGEAAGE